MTYTFSEAATQFLNVVTGVEQVLVELPEHTSQGTEQMRMLNKSLYSLLEHVELHYVGEYGLLVSSEKCW